jgi:hypothetical protein
MVNKKSLALGLAVSGSIIAILLGPVLWGTTGNGLVAGAMFVIGFALLISGIGVWGTSKGKSCDAPDDTPDGAVSNSYVFDKNLDCNFTTCSNVDGYYESPIDGICCHSIDHATGYDKGTGSNVSACTVTSCAEGFAASSDNTKCCTVIDKAMAYDSNCKVTSCSTGSPSSDGKSCA